MFITMPIKSFKLKDNKVFINESVIEYEDISADKKEILESLISKGAYGSALLTLNKFYNVKSINESDYTQEDYAKYLEECNKLMKECVSETEAHNFRPLINLNGLEIMESADHIARGKGNKLLIEDFRTTELNESEEHRYTGNSHADEVVFDFSQTERDIETFTKALNEISRMEYDNDIDSEKYDECIKKIQDLFVHKDKSIDDLKEECEGTQCSDIAGKKDQEVGSLQKPKKPKKHFTEMFNIPKKHGFKGFRLDEYGHYVRGKYILINEDGSIKATRKARVIDDYGNVIWDYNQVQEEQAPRLVDELNSHFNMDEFDIYDFGFRIEDNLLKVYDANEEFDFSYLDDKYEQANKILQDLFGKDTYFEAEIAPIGVVAGIVIKDLN